MIAVSDANNPSPHVKKRAAKMKVRMMSPFCYLVTPGEPGKAKRIVNFLYSPDSDKVVIDCCDTDGECCPANSFKLLCGHAEAAIRRLLANAKRQEKIESKEGQKRNRAVQSYARKIVSERLPGVSP